MYERKCVQGKINTFKLPRDQNIISNIYLQKEKRNKWTKIYITLSGMLQKV